jgi:hypothetical protein
MIYVIYCKDFYKYHNALPPSTIILQRQNKGIHILSKASRLIYKGQSRDKKGKSVQAKKSKP